MSVSNLTNTKWVFKNDGEIDDSTNFNYSIDFTSYNTNYTSINMVTGRVSMLYYDSDGAYSTTWNDQAYRIIEITGGTDATNVSLISWLMSNATQVPVVDLTDTTWSFGSSVVIENANQVQDYAINYSLEVEPNQPIPMILENGTSFEIYSYKTTEELPPPLANKCTYDVRVDVTGYQYFGGLLYQGLGQIFEYVSNSEIPTYPQTLDRTDNFSMTYVKKIMISSGTDIANPDLIAWLSQNATLQPNVSVKTFDLSTLQLSAGTHTVQVRARATGYRDSEFSNSVSYVVSGSYNVTVSITNESGLYRKRYFDIYDGQDNTGTLLYESLNSENTNPGIVVCQSGYLSFFLYSTDVVNASGHTTGNITPTTFTVGQNNEGTLFRISGDGTIVFDYLDWNA